MDGYQTLLRRFLFTGSEGNCYTPITFNPAVHVGNDEELSFSFPSDWQLKSITELRKTKEGRRAALEIIQEVFVKKGYIYKDAVFLSLAKLIHGKSGDSNDDPCRDARKFVLEVCPKNAIHDLFKFYAYLQGEVKYRNKEMEPSEEEFPGGAKKLSGGAKVGCAGRGIRGLISRWYNRQNPYEVAHANRRKRNPSHVMIIRKSHIRGDDIEHEVMLTYLMKGLNVAEKRFADKDGAWPLLEFYALKEKIKHATDSDEVVKLIRNHGFCDLQLIPTQFHQDRKVWCALLGVMPMPEVYGNLRLLASRGLIKHDEDEVSKKLMRNLTDLPALMHSKIQPAVILIFYLNCQNRWKPPIKDKKGVKPTDEVCESVLRAMEQMIRPSFDNLPRIQKERRIFIYVKVRDNLLEETCWRNANVTYMDAMAISILSLLNAAENAQRQIVICHTTHEKKVVSIDINPSDDLSDVKNKIKKAKYGLLDLSRPILWATEKKEKYDTFMFLTGTHTYCDKQRLYETLCTYQNEMKSQTRYLVAALCCKHGNSPRTFSIAKPNDEKMYDIAGFDGNVPRLIIDFINEEF